MDARPFGRTGIDLPVVGLGTWRVFDLPPAGQPTADAVVATVLDTGATVVDSSPMYGRAEAVLSAALGERRRDAFVATKVWTSSVADGRRHFTRQLGWYGGRIDLLQVHNLVAWREHLEWMERERGVGNVRWLGATTFQPSTFDVLERVMRSGRVHAIQVPLNPRERDGRGADPPARRGSRARRGRDAALRRRAACSAGHSRPRSRQAGLGGWAEALLRWTLADTRVTVAIPATSSAGHAAANVEQSDPGHRSIPTCANGSAPGRRMTGLSARGRR